MKNRRGDGKNRPSEVRAAIRYTREAEQALHRLGRLHEEYAAAILDIAVEKGLLKEVRLHEPFSEEDKAGVDITITTCDGKKHDLQIKSSAADAHDFSRKKHHRTIPVLILNLYSKPASVIHQLRCIFPWLSKFKLEHQEISDLYDRLGKSRGGAYSIRAKKS